MRNPSLSGGHILARFILCKVNTSYITVYILLSSTYALMTHMWYSFTVRYIFIVYTLCVFLFKEAVHIKAVSMRSS